MGSMQAAGYAQAVADGTVTMQDAIRAHLSSNCYPPVHPDFYPGVFSAVEYANAEVWDEPIVFPNGREFTSGEVIEKLHLGAFVFRADEEPFEVDL